MGRIRARRARSRDASALHGPHGLGWTHDGGTLPGFQRPELPGRRDRDVPRGQPARRMESARVGRRDARRRLRTLQVSADNLQQRRQRVGAGVLRTAAERRLRPRRAGSRVVVPQRARGVQLRRRPGDPSDLLSGAPRGRRGRLRAVQDGGAGAGRHVLHLDRRREAVLGRRVPRARRQREGRGLDRVQHSAARRGHGHGDRHGGRQGVRRRPRLVCPGDDRERLLDGPRPRRPRADRGRALLAALGRGDAHGQRLLRGREQSRLHRRESALHDHGGAGRRRGHGGFARERRGVCPLRALRQPGRQLRQRGGGVVPPAGGAVRRVGGRSAPQRLR